MRRLTSAGLFSSVFVAAVASLLACSSTETTYIDEPESPATDGGFDSQPSSDSGLGTLRFLRTQSFSGFDGTHTFRVPIAVYDSADDLTVTLADSSAAEVVAVKLASPVLPDGSTDNGKYFLVTTKKPGMITLRATSRGETAESTIVVTEYGAGRWEAGESRYLNGPDAENPPCANCHVNGTAIDHSPAALASAEDDEVAAIVTTGLANNHPIKVATFPNGHKWKVTPTELAGLVTYLRALEPKGFE